MNGTLDPLLVLDALEVGPVALEPRGFTAAYRIAGGREGEPVELAYRWEEDVFDPDEPGDRNLASLIAAQVALNYGLFAREIVLRGPFTEADRRFLRSMAANTAREIYVHKILSPNPFLVDEVRGLAPVRRRSYLQARLRFPDSELSARRPAWSAEPGRIAVLASGGKESLLSTGLLREAADEVHSVFVNESGRHWYTALNGYRHLAETDPERTVRVWTTADRVFAAMARHLPLVRPDFHRLRADDYPIRLWTVAVFLFGALPVLRRRGIGRLVIGDEFDTTRRRRRHGIPHYDGLYDQSRFFDLALSGFYRGRGWPLHQFSVLRPLSELLVQKTLLERYPDLQRHQLSCHAAHMREDRARPCGRCEKCRRVVAMIHAVGGDPGRCGYTAGQVEACLEAARGGGLHQEAEGVEQLRWLLAGGNGEGPRPEILRLRFDDLRSPVHVVPRDLRRELLSRQLEHARGAVERRGRRWIPFDPLSREALARPARYEGPPPRATPGGSGPEAPRGGGGADGAAIREPADATATDEGADGRGPSGGRTPDWLWGELTWPEARGRLRRVDTALLPVGAVEQHGPHLPLDTDAWDADHLCREVAARCSEPRPLVLPLIPYGVSYAHQDFPGTLSVGPETLARFVYDVGMSAARHGVTKLVIVNGHGGNMPTLQFAAQMINRDAHIFTCVDTGETSDADVADLTDTRSDVHAGEVETSTTLATRPHLVDLERAERFVPRFSSEYLDFSSAYGVEWYAHTSRISRSGVLGDPTRASVEKGREIWEIMIGHLVRFVESLKSMTLAELHERRS